MKIRVLDNESNRRNRFTKNIIGSELEVDEKQGDLVRCKGIFLYSDEFEVIEETVDLSKENKEPKEYKCVRKTIEFKLSNDGTNIDVIGAKVINEKEGITRL